MNRQRDVQRNSAFFLGAFGTALGVLGGSMAGLGILVWLLPDFAQTAPDWFFALVVIGIIVAIIGAWPALDWLLNSRPTLGGPVLGGLGAVLIAEGLVAIIYTAWGLAGWLAVAGGALLLPAAYLALRGGGTEPLTWGSLRTPGVQRMEARADVLVGVVFGVVGIGSLVVLVVFTYVNGNALPLLGLAAVGLLGVVWWRWPWTRM